MADRATKRANPSGVGYAPHRRRERRGTTRHIAVRAAERATVQAYRGTSAVLARVPPRISVPAARSLFLGAYAVWPEKRRYILGNASRVLGRPPDDPQVRRLARRIYATYARYVVELMRLPSRPPEETGTLVISEGERSFDSFDALFERLRAEERRGMIAVTGHLGNIEALAAAFAARGRPIYAVADDSGYPELYQLLAAQRRRWGVEVISWRNLREIYRVLRERSILGLVVDWGYRADGVPVRLFGTWTTLPAGPAVLAARTGAAIVPVHTWRREDGRFEAAHFDPIDVPDATPRSIALAMQRVADALEAMVAAAPEQWYTFKPMWPETTTEQAALASQWRQMIESGARRRESPARGP